MQSVALRSLGTLVLLCAVSLPQAVCEAQWRSSPRSQTLTMPHGQSANAPGATPRYEDPEPDAVRGQRYTDRARAGVGSINFLPRHDRTPGLALSPLRPYGQSATAPGATPYYEDPEPDTPRGQRFTDRARAGAGEFNFLPHRDRTGLRRYSQMRLDPRYQRRITTRYIQQGILAPTEYARWQDAYRMGIFADTGEWEGRTWYIPAWYHYHPFWMTEQFYAPGPWYYFNYAPRYRQGVDYRYYRYIPQYRQGVGYWSYRYSPGYLPGYGYGYFRYLP